MSGPESPPPGLHSCPIRNKPAVGHSSNSIFVFKIESTPRNVRGARGGKSLSVLIPEMTCGNDCEMGVRIPASLSFRGSSRSLRLSAQDQERDALHRAPIQDPAAVDDDLSFHSREIRRLQPAPVGPVVVDDAHIRAAETAPDVKSAKRPV